MYQKVSMKFCEVDPLRTSISKEEKQDRLRGSSLYDADLSTLTIWSCDT